jgi:hypothetical protein
MNDLQIAEQSERIVDMLMTDDADLHKTAAQELDDYTRERNREGSFAHKIIEPSPFDKNKLERQMHSDQPVMLFEFEPTAPFAAPMDYGTRTADFIPKCRRYPVVFGVKQTRRVVFQLLELQTYKHDVRAIMGDNMVKELTVLRDTTLINASRQIVGNVGQTLPWVGKAMHVDTGNPMSTSAFIRAKNHLKDTPFTIQPTKVLMNHLRLADLEVAAVEDLSGTDKAVDVAINGFSEVKWANMNIMMTIKKNLVPPRDTFWYGAQEYLGRHVIWQEPTMVVEKKMTEVFMQMYEIYGMTIAHPGALGIQKFLG